MAINLTTRNTTAPARETGPDTGRRRRLLTVPGVVGIGYSLSWIAGLAVPAPSPRFGAPGAEVVAALAGHGPAVATQFVLTEGLPAAGIAVISVALARLARRRGAAGPARFALVSGLVAAIISAVQFGLGLALTVTQRRGRRTCCTHRSTGWTGPRCSRWPCWARPRRP